MAVLLLSLPPRSARADKLPELADTLTTSKHEKARIAAAVSLGRLRDRRAVKALVRGLLKDDSRVVRAVAATSLGHLGDAAALPALRRATSDKDRAVRKRALDAIDKISKGLKQSATGTGSSRPIRSEAKLARYKIAARESPRLAPKQPGLYVVLKSATDHSSGPINKMVRKRRASTMRTLVAQELSRTTAVTVDRERATELGLSPYSIDVSIMKLDRAERGSWVEIECEIRIAISDQRGKMLSLLTGGAKVQVPRGTFRIQYERVHQAEALENAVKSVYQDMIKYLSSQPPG